jgi:hypothetical protein
MPLAQDEAGSCPDRNVAHRIAAAPRVVHDGSMERFTAARRLAGLREIIGERVTGPLRPLREAEPSADSPARPS